MAEVVTNWGNAAHRRPQESQAGQQAGRRDQRAGRHGAHPAQHRETTSLHRGQASPIAWLPC
jgi:hypothetical protein